MAGLALSGAGAVVTVSLRAGCWRLQPRLLAETTWGIVWSPPQPRLDSCIFAPLMWPLTTGFGLAVRACLAVLVCSLCDFYFFPVWLIRSRWLSGLKPGM